MSEKKSTCIHSCFGIWYIVMLFYLERFDVMSLLIRSVGYNHVLPCAMKCIVLPFVVFALNSYAFLSHLCFFLVRVNASNFCVKFCGQLQKLLLLMQLSRQLGLQIRIQ